MPPQAVSQAQHKATIAFFDGVISTSTSDLVTLETPIANPCHTSGNGEITLDSRDTIKGAANYAS